MINAAILAGYLAAHAVWSVSDGETLIPIYGYLSGKGERVVERLAYHRLEQGVAARQERLNINLNGYSAAVLVFDGRINLDAGKKDALIVEFRSYGDTPGFVVVAVPYTPLSDHTDFAVHRPKVLDMSEHLRSDIHNLLDSFFTGVDQHAKAAKIWSAHLDESM
ncbi:hypothetical protein [Thiosocius teredinicola]|uniref:hypothetical protein n=1 Tax=Thiosocius teredinicola TaxID=1973002 RepID=UPI00099111D5